MESHFLGHVIVYGWPGEIVHTSLGLIDSHEIISLVDSEMENRRIWRLSLSLYVSVGYLYIGGLAGVSMIHSSHKS